MAKITMAQMETLARLRHTRPSGQKLIEFEHRTYDGLSCYRTLENVESGKRTREMFRIDADGTVRNV